jgi:hypothetical protein
MQEKSFGLAIFALAAYCRDGGFMGKLPTGISDYMAAIGRKGGKATGVAKGFAAVSPEERSDMARRAAEKRWGTKKTAAVAKKKKAAGRRVNA